MKSTEILLNIINTIYILCCAIPSNENFNYVLSQLYTQREPFISVHEKLCSPREFYCMKKMLYSINYPCGSYVPQG